MDSQSSTEAERTSLVPAAVGVILGGLALLASWWGQAPSFAFVSAASVAAGADAAAVLSYRGIRVSRVLTAIAVLAFPLIAYTSGEQHLGLTAALVVIGIAAVYVVAGVRPESLRNLSATILTALYLGLLGGFAILVRRHESGDRLVFAFALIFGGYQIGSWIGTAGLGGARVMPSVSATLKWWGVVFGLAGGLLGSLLALTFMEPPFGPSTAASLAAVVGVSALIGDLAGRMLRRDLGIGERLASIPGMGGFVARLDRVALSLPAFYYGFRLYLT